MGASLFSAYVVLWGVTICYYAKRVINNRSRERAVRAEATQPWYQTLLLKFGRRTSASWPNERPTRPEHWYLIGRPHHLHG
jgi:hypothetical protein